MPTVPPGMEVDVMDNVAGLTVGVGVVGLLLPDLAVEEAPPPQARENARSATEGTIRPRREILIKMLSDRRRPLQAVAFDFCKPPLAGLCSIEICFQWCREHTDADMPLRLRNHLTDLSLRHLLLSEFLA